MPTASRQQGWRRRRGNGQALYVGIEISSPATTSKSNAQYCFWAPADAGQHDGEPMIKFYDKLDLSCAFADDPPKNPAVGKSCRDLSQTRCGISEKFAAAGIFPAAARFT